MIRCCSRFAWRPCGGDGLRSHDLTGSQPSAGERDPFSSCEISRITPSATAASASSAITRPPRSWLPDRVVDPVVPGRRGAADGRGLGAAAAAAAPALFSGRGGAVASRGVVAAVGCSSSAPSSASTNAVAVGYRPPWSFAIARRRTPSTGGGSVGSRSLAFGGSSSMCWRACAAKWLAVNGRPPVSSSNPATASEYRSLAPVASRPSACSGARYAAVPNSSPLLVIVSSLCSRAIPKSATCRPRSRSSRKFAGLMSRWTIPRSWAWSSAEAASRSQRRASSRVTESQRSASATVPPGRCSITMNALGGEPRPSGSMSPMSKIVTTCGWAETRAAARASRLKRRIASSSWAKRSDSTLIATRRSRTLSSAHHTEAIPPVAIWRLTL